MARAAAALPAPRVTLVLSRTVAKVDSKLSCQAAVRARIRRAQMDPVLGEKIVERQQLVDVIGDLPGRLGPLRAVGLLECGRRHERVLTVLSVADLLQGLAGTGLSR
jgi:hypothetical protein